MSKPSQKKDITPDSTISPKLQKINENTICSPMSMDKPACESLKIVNKEESDESKEKHFETVEPECDKRLPTSDLMPNELESVPKGLTEESSSCQNLSAPVLKSSEQYSNKTMLDPCTVECSDFAAVCTKEKMPGLNNEPSEPCHLVEMQEQIDNNTVNVSSDSSNIFSIADEVANLSCMTCPVCNATFCAKDITLTKFNNHLDTCLNRKTIRELVKSESRPSHSQTTPASRKRRKNHKSPVPKKNNKPLGTLDLYLTK